MWFTTSDARSVTACGPCIMPSDPAAPRCLTGVAARGRCFDIIRLPMRFPPGSDQVALWDQPRMTDLPPPVDTPHVPRVITPGRRRDEQQRNTQPSIFHWEQLPRTLPVNMSWQRQRVMEARVAVSRLAAPPCSRQVNSAPPSSGLWWL